MPGVDTIPAGNGHAVVISNSHITVNLLQANRCRISAALIKFNIPGGDISLNKLKT